MAWQVGMTPKARKQAASLPRKAKDALILLMGDMEAGGPVRGDWPNYSRLAELQQAVRNEAPLPYQEGEALLCGGVGSH